MKTTLKRGVGRSAPVNGNGRADQLPGALTPITRYEQPGKRRGIVGILGRVLFFLVAASVSLLVGIGGGYWLEGEQTVLDISKVSLRDPQIRKASQKLEIPLPNRPAIAMVVGQDFRKWAKGDERGGRADTVMLLRADPGAGKETLSMLSFPRDLMVNIHCNGRTPFLGPINGAFAACGLQGTVETVKQLTGLPIHYIVTIDYRGFIQTVDKLGGIWMDIDRRYFNDNSNPGPEGTFPPIDLMPGYQKLGGRAALSFVRYRHTDSDLYRIERQRLFMRALKERLSSSFKPTAIPKLTGVIRGNVRIAQGGGKALDPDVFRGWAFFGLELPPGRVFQSKIGGLYGSGTAGDPLQTDPSNIRAAVDEFQTPDVDAGEKATAAALGQRLRLRGAAGAAPPARRTSIVVLNGNGITGSAANASYLLGQRGYRMLQPPEGVAANAPSRVLRTQVYFDRSQRGSRAAARSVANLFGSADVTGAMTPIFSRFANSAMLVVVVGNTFHNTLAPAPVDRTPKRRRPYVTRNPGATLGLLRSIKRRAGFPLMVPSLIERSSWTDTRKPLRIYPITKDDKAVRLTFRTGAQEYWGVQQTTWEDAPILSGNNVTRRLGGREYDLYYDGAQLHMVVLKTDKATYWVVNTLRDTLSNETMLSIARGLRPLDGAKKKQ
jgi:LCP family protein required for cell wall assembly